MKADGKRFTNEAERYLMGLDKSQLESRGRYPLTFASVDCCPRQIYAFCLSIHACDCMPRLALLSVDLYIVYLVPVSVKKYR